MLRWQDVGMFNMTNDVVRAFYRPTPPWVAWHVVSSILSLPTPPLVNLILRKYKAGEDTFKRFKLVLEKETVELLVVLFLHATWYGIRYLRKCVPRFTFSDSYDILSQLHRDTVELLNTSYITQLFFNKEIDFWLQKTKKGGMDIRQCTNERYIPGL